MKLSNQTIIIAILLAVLLFIIGAATWNSLFELIIPTVGDVKYYDTGMTGHFRSSMRYSLILALIPITTILIWRFAPVLSIQKKISTVCIIVLAIAMSVFIRREMTISKAKNLKPVTTIDYSDYNNPKPKLIDLGIPINSLNFELFAFMGLIAGSIISCFSLRQKRKNS